MASAPSKATAQSSIMRANDRSSGEVADMGITIRAERMRSVPFPWGDCLLLWRNLCPGGGRCARTFLAANRLLQCNHERPLTDGIRPGRSRGIGCPAARMAYDENYLFAAWNI